LAQEGDAGSIYLLLGGIEAKGFGSVEGVVVYIDHLGHYGSVGSLRRDGGVNSDSKSEDHLPNCCTKSQLPKMPILGSFQSRSTTCCSP